jgi:hypothetical protein
MTLSSTGSSALTLNGPATVSSTITYFRDNALVTIAGPTVTSSLVVGIADIAVYLNLNSGLFTGTLTASGNSITVYIVAGSSITGTNLAGRLCCVLCRVLVRASAECLSRSALAQVLCSPAAQAQP